MKDDDLSHDEFTEQEVRDLLRAVLLDLNPNRDREVMEARIEEVIERRRRRCGVCAGRLVPSQYGGLIHDDDAHDDHTPTEETPA